MVKNKSKSTRILKRAAVKKMQSVSFRSIDEFLEFLPADELKIVQLLRETIFNAIPGITEKLSYNVPFYKKNKGMFFIWPAAILWGKTKTYEGVRFGFQQGYLLRDDLNYLDKGDRKQVYYKDFQTLKETDLDILKTYIYDSNAVDNSFNLKNGIK